MFSIFSTRLLEILRILATHDDYVTTQSLAEVLGVSSRTIFRELENINGILKPYGVSVHAKTGHGYFMQGDKNQKELLVKNIEATRNPLTYTNPEARRELLILQCLKEREITKLSTLAYMFEVSEGTISRDLEIIESWFENYNLKLLRRQGFGVYVEGEEENIRKALTDYVHQKIELGAEDILNAFNVDVVRYFDRQEEGILGLLDKEILVSVIQVLEQCSVNISNKITNHSYIGLIIHLSIAVERVRKSDLIEMDTLTLDAMKQDPLYRDAYIIATDIEDRFKIEFPEAEVGYIFMHLQGTRPRALDDSLEHFNDNYEAMMIADRLIERFSYLLKVDFSADVSLRTGLMAHLKPTLNRLKYDLEIRNPLLEEIKSQYFELFEIVKETSHILYFESQYDLSDDEIGYLTLHFGAAIERRKHELKTGKRVKIGVVCASGIGISTLLASKLKTAFVDAQSIEPYSVDDVGTDAMSDVDLIVSTIFIEDLRPIVFVNPLLKHEDIVNIRVEMDAILSKDRKTDRSRNQDNLDLNLVKEIQLVEVDLNHSSCTTIENLINHLSQADYAFERIKASVLEREENGAVIIEASQFVMYHGSVPGLMHPEILFFRNTNHKKHGDYENIEIGVLMVIPKPAKSLDRKTMSKITESMIDEPKVLHSVAQYDLKGLRESVYQYLT